MKVQGLTVREPHQTCANNVNKFLSTSEGHHSVAQTQIHWQSTRDHLNSAAPNLAWLYIPRQNARGKPTPDPRQICRR